MRLVSMHRAVVGALPTLVACLTVGLLTGLGSARVTAQQPPAVPAAPAATSLLVEIASARSDALASQLEDEGFDVLPGAGRAGAVRLVVQPAELGLLQAEGWKPVVIERGRPWLEIEAEQQSGSGDAPLPAGYLTLTQIEAQLDALQAAHPTLAEVVDLTAAYGTPPTFEGRHLLALKISDHVALDEDEPALLLVTAHHCREITTPVIALTAAQKLLDGYGVDPQITAAVDGYEIWIAPVWNPDGYEYVFNTDNLWRKNRRPLTTDVGVDLNRNYPLGWSSSCSGSTVESSETYKGPAPSSEAETQTMLAFSADRRFDKVLDYHSFGQHVLWGYLCSSEPLGAFLHSEATALSAASGYGGANQPPSAEGEEEESALAFRASHAFLIEVDTQFQPPFATAQATANLVWPGVQWMLQRPIPMSGHVTDACTNLPLQASITVAGLVFTNGETNSSGGPFGRYHVFLPPGNYTVSFSSAGHVTASVPLAVTATSAVVQDVALVPTVPAGCWTDLGLAKPGIAGPPKLKGQGTLQSGAACELDLVSAAPLAVAHLVVGLTQLNAPLKGGVLVPSPDVFVVLLTAADGSLKLPFVWPAGIPAGTHLFFQDWVEDGSASFGLSVSNGLQAAAG